MELGEIITSVKESKLKDLPRLSSKSKKFDFSEVEEILDERSYLVFKNLLELSKSDYLYYHFFENKGFIPLDLKDEYIEGKKIYNERKGHYFSEDIN